MLLDSLLLDLQFLSVNQKKMTASEIEKCVVTYYIFVTFKNNYFSAIMS